MAQEGLADRSCAVHNRATGRPRMSLPKPQSYRLRLALDLIEEHFGDITRDVAHLIATIDHCTLAILLRVAQMSLAPEHKLTAKQIRQALLVLLRHNCLIVECAHDLELPETLDVSALADVKLGTVGLLYKLDVENVLHRMRYGRLLKIVSDKFSATALQIMEEVIVAGRLRFGDISELLQAQGAGAEAQAAFEALVQHRFLVNVPPLDVKRRVLAESELSSKASRKMAAVLDGGVAKPKASGVKRTRDDMMRSAGLEASAAEAAAAGPANMLPVELRMMLASEKEEEWTDAAPAAAAATASAPAASAAGRTAGRGGRGGGRGGRGRGRGPSSASSVAVGDAQADDKAADASGGVRADAYWTVGHDQLVREERHRACVQVVADQLEQYAGDIVAVVLQHSMASELGPRPSKSAPMGLHDIHRKLGEAAAASASAASASSSGSSGPAGPSGAAPADLCLDVLKRLVELMRLSSLQAVLKVAGSDADAAGPQYVVNYDSILAALRKRTIHRAAVGRFGVFSARIVELLFAHKYLEQQVVGDRAILPARETRERLYRLQRDQWVSYVELSRRGDFNPSSSMYFWYLDMPRLREALLEHVLKALYCLRLRRLAELARHKDLIDLVSSASSVSQHDQRQYEAIMTRDRVLMQAAQRLDNTLLLMDQF